MDRNTFTGLFLIMIILAGGVFFMRPSEAEIKKEKQVQDSIKNAGSKSAKKQENLATAAVKTIDTAALKGPFGANIAGTEQTTVIENENLKVTLSNLGGKIKSVEVKNEKTYSKKPLILFDGDQNKFGLNLNIAGKSISTNDLYFTATKTGNGITMRANYSADKFIDFVYTLPATGNNVDFNINLNGLNQF